MRLEKLLSLSSKNKYAVLMYHGVVETVDPKLNGRHLDVSQFEEHLRYLKKNFNVVPLSGIFGFKSGKITPGKKTVAITFDDGYLNNYSVAYPVLKKYNIPATFFIITAGLDDARFVNWPDVLDIIHRYSGREELSFDNHLFKRSAAGFYSEQLNSSLLEYIKTLGTQREKLLDELKTSCGFSNLQEQAPPGYWQLVNSKQVIELQESGLIEIGSHTRLHYNLGNIPDALVEEELHSSREKLGNLLGKPVTTIAYPDGSYTGEVKQASRDCGYKNLVAVSYKTASDRMEEDIINRFCVSNTTSFDSNMIQLHLFFSQS